MFQNTKICGFILFLISFFQYIQKNNKMANIIELSKISVFEEFLQKMSSIDQIARIAINERHKKITEKYGNIHSNTKMLKSLILEFTKKSIKLEQELRHSAKIEDLSYQTQYYSQRLQVCLRLSSTLQTSIANKKDQIQKYEEELKKFNEQLVMVKTQNIKKILKIQMLQKIEKENELKLKKDLKIATFKQKMTENRALMQTGLTYNYSTVDLLCKEKQDLEKQLWKKINKKIAISNYLMSNYHIIKQKLIKKQKKSTLLGLNGSLLFKIQENIKVSNRIGLQIQKKNKYGHKLLIYDILKQKHSKQIEAQKKKQNKILIEQRQFMKFSPIQIIGLIELKGGINYLESNGKDFFSQIKNKPSHQKIKECNKERKNYIKFPIGSVQS